MISEGVSRVEVDTHLDAFAPGNAEIAPLQVGAPRVLVDNPYECALLRFGEIFLLVPCTWNIDDRGLRRRWLVSLCASRRLRRGIERRQRSRHGIQFVRIGHGLAHRPPQHADLRTAGLGLARLRNRVALLSPR